MDAETGLILYDGKPSSSPADGRSRRGRPTREQSEKRHSDLLEHALDLFLERGFEGTSIEAIVDAVGMARRTVYARYGDKHSLFKAALQRLIDELVVPVDTLRQLETDDLEATLLNVNRLILSSMRSPNGLRLTRIANAEVFRMPEIGAYFWDRTGRVTISYLTDLFGRRLSSVPTADAALSFYLLAIEGSFRSWIWLRPPEPDFERQMAYRIQLFLRGVRALPDKSHAPERRSAKPRGSKTGAKHAR
jgi:AcrR family transcriptional regulator